MTYDPIVYWIGRGPTYERRLAPGLQDAQERVLAPILARLDYASVLDAGCGYGRLGALLRDDASYTGIDVSPHLLAAAAKRIPGGEFIETTMLDFRTRRRWDLVACLQVLMHVPRADIEATVARLLSLSRRWVVTCDWTPTRAGDRFGNFAHDYPALFGEHVAESHRVGAQTIYVLRK